METWWNSLSTLGRVYFCIGLAATVLLILQIVTLLFGLGDDDLEVDLNGDGEADASIAGDGFNLFTFRGLVAFFAIGGWTGYILADDGAALAIIVSVLAGLAALFAMAFIMKGIMRTRSNGNIDVQKAIGLTAEVYLTIPAAGNGLGKVNLVLEERFVELSAVQTANEPIATGSRVKITGVAGGSLVVEKI